MPRTWSPTPARRSDPELMDAPGLPAAEVADAYRVLTRVNGWFGNRRTLTREVARFADEDRPDGPVAVLDVGCGGGDLPRDVARALEACGHPTRAVGLDLDATAAALARDRGIGVVRGDALRLPFPDRAFDLVTAVKFAHHLSGPPLGRLIAEMARVARRRVIVLDLRRDWLAYAGFLAWSRVFTRNRLVRYDGPLSVLRGFTPAELSALGAGVPGFAWSVRASIPYQLALVGRRLPA